VCPAYAGGAVHSGIRGQEAKVFYPVGLAVLSLMVAANLSRHLGITVIFVETAAILTVFIIQGQRLDSTRAALRFLIIMSLVVPFFLLAAWRIDLYNFSGGQVTAEFSRQTVFFIFSGFAIWLAVVPFHGWLITVAGESSPATAAFVLIMFPMVAFSTLLHLLVDLPWLIEAPQLVTAIIVAGVLSAFIGGGLAAVQRSFSQLMGYAALFHLGVTLALVGIGGQAAFSTILVLLVVRVLALLLVVAGIAAIRANVPGDGFAEIKGLAYRIPAAITGLMIGGFALAGMPLTAGFAPYWQLLQSLADMNAFWPVLLILGGLGVTVGFLRGFWASLVPRKNHTGRHAKTAVVFTEPPALLVMVGFLVVISVALSLFPWLLIQPFQQLFGGIPFPVQ
jgi:formate hydrogenlyase subunit 3/multisubunit Na+/H+ antiporter MnhD subunit